MDKHVTPHPTLDPHVILKDFGKTLIPTIGLGLVAGTAIVAIVAGIPRVCVDGPQSCPITQENLIRRDK